MKKETAEFIGRLAGVVLVIVSLVSLGLWFGWDSFLTLFGLPTLAYYQALGATTLIAIVLSAIYLLKEDFHEDN